MVSLRRYGPDGLLLTLVCCLLQSGCTPLMMAALKGDTKVAEVLIAEGADILIEDDVRIHHVNGLCLRY